jgi:hypothetical protein
VASKKALAHGPVQVLHAQGMEQIDIQKLSAIPYLDLGNLQGRFVTTLSFYDSGWKFWITSGGQLLEMKAWPAESFYFSRTPEAPTDPLFNFLDFIAQRASIPPVHKPFSAMQ